MDALSDTLYHALQGFETQQAMQYNRCIGLPCWQIVRIGVEVAQIMLGDELVEEHLHSYLSLIRNDRQASRCRAALGYNGATTSTMPTGPTAWRWMNR